MDINYNFLENQRKKVKFFNCYILRNFIKNKYFDGIIYNGVEKMFKNELRKVVYSNEFLFKAKLILKMSNFRNSHKNTDLNYQQKNLKAIEIQILKFHNKEKNQKKQFIKNFTVYNSQKKLNHQGKFFLKNNNLSWKILSSLVIQKIKNINSNNAMISKFKVKKKSIDFLCRIMKIFKKSFKILFYLLDLNQTYLRIKKKIIYKYF